jgi:hypothetical protein
MMWGTLGFQSLYLTKKHRMTISRSILLGCAILVSCMVQAPRLAAGEGFPPLIGQAPWENNDRILLLGEGYGYRVPAVLRATFRKQQPGSGIVVDDAGCSLQNAPSLLAAHLTSGRYAVIIISFGSDAAGDTRKLEPDAYREALRNLLRAARAGGEVVVLVSPLPGEAANDKVKAIGTIGRELASEEALAWVDLAEITTTPVLHNGSWSDSFIAAAGVPLAKAMNEGLSKAPWWIEMPPTLFLDSVVLVPIVHRVPAASIELRVSTDGKDPNPQVKPPAKPLELRSTTMIKWLATHSDGTTQRGGARYEKAKLRLPDKIKDPLPGLMVDLFDGYAQKEITATAPAPRTASWLGVDYDVLGQARLQPIPDENFTLRFRGYLSAPEDGVYEFQLRGDDGIVLRIGDEQIAATPGGWGTTQATGQIALKQGVHQTTIMHWQSRWGRELSVMWRLQGGRFQPIPDMAWVRPAKDIPPVLATPPAAPAK